MSIRRTTVKCNSCSQEKRLKMDIAEASDEDLQSPLTMLPRGCKQQCRQQIRVGVHIATSHYGQATVLLQAMVLTATVAFTRRWEGGEVCRTALHGRVSVCCQTLSSTRVPEGQTLGVCSCCCSLRCGNFRRVDFDIDTWIVHLGTAASQKS